MNEFFSSSRGRAALIVAAVVIVLGVGGGYYFLTGHKTAPGSTPATQTASLADIGICKAVVARARDYGVLPPDAAKSGERVVDSSDPNRVTCSAQANDATFKLVADVACDDANKSECLLLQKVTTADGKSLYNTQNI